MKLHSCKAQEYRPRRIGGGYTNLQLQNEWLHTILSLAAKKHPKAARLEDAQILRFIGGHTHSRG
jgi:hypothetical protein